MNGDVLLDTNPIVALFASDEAILRRLDQSGTVFVPCVVLAELYYGANKSGRVSENLARVEEFAAESAILDCDVDTARHFGRIKDDLRRKGRPIPENDIWIAALALQYDLTLLSRDGHFREVDGLVVEAW